MKEYDRVELISDKQRYIDEGLKKGDKGTILGPKRSGMWLVYFDGEIFQGSDGVWQTTEIDSAVLEEDLIVIEESDWDGTSMVAVSKNGATVWEFHDKGWAEEREKELEARWRKEVLGEEDDK